MTIYSDTARSEGFDVERINHLESVIQRDIDSNEYGGASLVVTRNDQLIVNGSYGYCDAKRANKATENQVFASMSLGKNITVVNLLQRIDKGQVAFTDLVSKHIPEYGCRGKERTTVLDLLAQRSGLPKYLPVPPEHMGNHDINVQVACASLPETEPGSAINYSYTANHTIIAEIVRRLDESDKSYREVIKSDLLTPLGMNDTTLGLPEERKSLAAEVYPNFDEAGLFSPAELAMLGAAVISESEAEVPGGGFFTTAQDISKLARMLCNGGELNGTRILSPALVNQIHEVVTGNASNSLWGYTMGLRNWREMPANLTPGFFARGEGIHPTPFGLLASPRTIGGIGAGSNCFWVDPERNLTFSLLTAGLLEDSHSLDRHQRLSDLVLSAIIE